MFSTSARASRSFMILSRVTSRCLATEKSNRAVDYLEAWVGSPAPNTRTVEAARTKSRVQSDVSPLFLTGSSYLMPTLRIERKDTAESISNRIAMVLEESSPTNGATIKSMLKGKQTASHGVARWHVPLVLDLSALVPDGSPHYTPPQPGLLTGLVNTLKEYGIRVVGVTNSPAILEEEAIHKLGLPSFMSKGRVLDRSTSKARIEDVIQMVLARTMESENDDIRAEVIQDSQSKEELVSPDVAEVEEAVEAKDSIDIKVSDVNGDDILSEHMDNDDDTTPSLPSSLELGTQVYHGSVRSGQQVTAQANKSLIIIGSVNSGGEVLSDRDIFVFGKLRGRALAGLGSANNGGANVSARIFSTSFDPELICIGDTFTTVGDVKDLGLPRPGEAAMVSLNSQQELVFEHISL